MNENSVKISAVVLTKNSEKTIEKCLKSLMWCDEIVVVDSGSTDDTLKVASQFTKIIYGEDWHGYSEQRNLGANLASNNWILFIDSDEEATRELALEIVERLEKDNNFVAFYIHFKTYMFGRWMKYSGLGREKHIRMFDKRFAKWSGQVHEEVDSCGKIGVMYSCILHYAYENVASLVYKVNLYTNLEAKRMLQQKTRFSLPHAIFETVGVFVYKYFLQLGFLDGYQGLIWDFSLSYYRFIKWMKFWEISRNGSSNIYS